MHISPTKELHIAETFQDGHSQAVHADDVINRNAQ